MRMRRRLIEIALRAGVGAFHLRLLLFHTHLIDRLACHSRLLLPTYGLLLFLMSASRGQTEHRDFGHLWPVIFLYLSSSSYVLFIFIFTFVFALPFATLTAATV